MNDLIRDQEKAALSRAGELVDRLEKEIGELRKREDQLKQLSLTEDHINFLQVRKQSNTWIILCAGQQLMMCFACLQHCQAIFDCTEPDLSSDVNIQLHTPFDFVTKAISDLRDKMESVAKSIAQISETSKMRS